MSSRPNFELFKIGDQVIAVHSMTGRQGETGTIVAIDDSKRFCPLMVQFADGFQRLYSAAALQLATMEVVT